MENKSHGAGSSDRPRVVRSHEHAERDTARPAVISPGNGQQFVQMQNEFERRCKENAAGNHNDVVRGR